MSGRLPFAIFLALLALAPPALAQAQTETLGPPQAQTERRPTASGSALEPLDRILPTIRNTTPGRFFDAEGPFPDRAGGWHYGIKWLTPEGRIVWLDTDARTGKILGPYRGLGGMVMPPAGLRYYPFLPGPRGFRGRFGGWRPGGWRGGFGPGGRRR